eukprot:675981-Prorocentrum_minimum.AAC.1
MESGGRSQVSPSQGESTPPQGESRPLQSESTPPAGANRTLRKANRPLCRLNQLLHRSELSPPQGETTPPQGESSPPQGESTPPRGESTPSKMRADELLSERSRTLPPQAGGYSAVGDPAAGGGGRGPASDARVWHPTHADERIQLQLWSGGMQFGAAGGGEARTRAGGRHQQRAPAPGRGTHGAGGRRQVGTLLCPHTTLLPAACTWTWHTWGWGVVTTGTTTPTLKSLKSPIK